MDSYPTFGSGDVEFLVRTQNVLNISFYGSFTPCAPLLHISIFQPLSAIIIFSVCCSSIRPSSFTNVCQHNNFIDFCVIFVAFAATNIYSKHFHCSTPKCDVF